MRIAVISDIHGNDVAFKAVLAEIDHKVCDKIVCLGDAVQGGPQPAEVVQRLRERRIQVVMGNADSWLLSGLDSGAEEIPETRWEKMVAARSWSLSQLSAEDREFIGGFEPTITMELENGESLFCFHGSPRSFDDLILADLPRERFRELLPLDQFSFFCGGHTHVQFVRQLGKGFHFNPGNVGYSYRHDRAEADFRADPFAEYAILEVDGPVIGLEFRRIPFDVEKLLSTYRSCGRPYPEEALASYR